MGCDPAYAEEQLAAERDAFRNGLRDGGEVRVEFVGHGVSKILTADELYQRPPGINRRERRRSAALSR